MSFKLIVGLGNCGASYESTRHNIGFRIIDDYAQKVGYSSWKLESALNAFVLKVPQVDGHLFLAKSNGYMNHSGEPVRKICSFFKIQSTEVIVVCDDITLDLGVTKITEQPGTAGHNGVKDILGKIGPGFVRFRVGIGGKKHPDMVLGDYVLSRFDTEEIEILAQKMSNICSNLQLLLDKGTSEAMTVINRNICQKDLTGQV